MQKIYRILYSTIKTKLPIKLRCIYSQNDSLYSDMNEEELAVKANSRYFY